MAISEQQSTQRNVSYSINADGTVGPISLHDHFKASYHLARRNAADGSMAVEGTNDPNQNDWFELSSHSSEALNELSESLEAVRFKLSGNTTGTHYVHVYRIER